MKRNHELSYQVNTVRWDGKFVSRLPEESYLPQFRLLKSLGIREVMLSGYVTLEEADFDMDAETLRMGDLLDSMGMRPAQHHGLASVYAPLGASQEPVIERLIRSVRYTANLHSPALVIHPGHYYDPASWNKITVNEFYDAEVSKHGVEAVLETAARNLHEAALEAEKLGVKIALENVDRFEPMGGAALLPRLVATANSPAVGFCLDSGHAHCCGQTRVADWVPLMGNKLFTTHFHDNRGARLDALTDKKWIRPSDIDEHLPPGFGTIPWIDVIQTLDAIGYANTVNFESGAWPDCEPEEGYRHAIRFWRTLEFLADQKAAKKH